MRRLWKPHWSRRYIRSRTLVGLDQLLHPRAPWLVRGARRWLESELRSSFVGIEWGSGRSTRWLARRVKRVVSIETNPNWYQRVTHRLQQSRLNNVDYVLVPIPYQEGFPGEKCVVANRQAYGEAYGAIPDGTLDFAFVDGCHRALCVGLAIDLLKPGGILVLDNSNRFLPTDSRVPERYATPRDDDWLRLSESLRQWRKLVFADGVTETSVWIKHK